MSVVREEIFGPVVVAQRFDDLDEVAKAANDTRGAIDRLSAQIEPAGLSKEINVGSASRDDLEAFRRDLRTAEANATAFLPRYGAIFKAEHDQIESAALSLHVPKEIASRGLNGLTQRQANSMPFQSHCRRAPTIIAPTRSTSHYCRANLDRSRSSTDTSFFRFSAPSNATTPRRRP